MALHPRSLLTVALALVASQLSCKKPAQYRYHLEVPHDTAGLAGATDDKAELRADGQKIADVTAELSFWVPAKVWLTKSKVTLHMPTTCGDEDDVLLATKATPEQEADERDDRPENVFLAFTVSPPVVRQEVVVDNVDGGEPLAVQIGKTKIDVPPGKHAKVVVRTGQCGWPDVTVGGASVGPLLHTKKGKASSLETVLVDGTGKHCYLAHDVSYAAPGEAPPATEPDQRFGPGPMHAIADVSEWFSVGALTKDLTRALAFRHVDHATCGSRD